jgi:hypothetical protein
MPHRHTSPTKPSERCRDSASAIGSFRQVPAASVRRCAHDLLSMSSSKAVAALRQEVEQALTTAVERASERREVTQQCSHRRRDAGKSSHGAVAAIVSSPSQAAREHDGPCCTSPPSLLPITRSVAGQNRARGVSAAALGRHSQQ